MKITDIKSPWFGTAFLIIAMALYFGISYICRAAFGVFDIEEVGATEVLTYLFYGFGGGIIFCCAKDFMSDKSKLSTFAAISFLYIVMIFRDMGAQKWLTSTDTTVTKIRFFTNPTNPIHEKIIAGSLMILAVAVFLYVLIKSIKPLLKGIAKFEPISWTTLTLLVWTPITQIADRVPAEFLKANGVMLAEPIRFILKILEEGGESLLPLLIAIEFLQYHVIYSKNKQTKN